MVRALIPRALGCRAVPGCRSTRSEVTPAFDSRMEAVKPTGPPPTMRTSTSRIRGTCPSPWLLSKASGDATVALGGEPIRDDIQLGHHRQHRHQPPGHRPDTAAGQWRLAQRPAHAHNGGHEQMGTPPWSKRIIADERNLVTLIATPPGGGNRPHWHKEFDEWWVVLGGRLQWELTGGIVVNAAKDDIVWVPRGTVHHIRNLGDELSIRLAGAMTPAMHYFSPCEQCGFTDDGPREWRA